MVQWRRGSDWHTEAFTREWVSFHGDGWGGTFSIHPLAVAKWRSAKATLPKKWLKLKKVSQLNLRRDAAPRAPLTAAPCLKNKNKNKKKTSLRAGPSHTVTHTHTALNMARHVLSECDTTTCISSKRYYLETGWRARGVAEGVRERRERRMRRVLEGSDVHPSPQIQPK